MHLTKHYYSFIKADNGLLESVSAKTKSSLFSFTELYLFIQEIMYNYGLATEVSSCKIDR